MSNDDLPLLGSDEDMDRLGIPRPDALEMTLHQARSALKLLSVALDVAELEIATLRAEVSR